MPIIVIQGRCKEASQVIALLQQTQYRAVESHSPLAEATEQEARCAARMVYSIASTSPAACSQMRDHHVRHAMEWTESD
eukprot:5298920-Amphidinium_carterae.1